MNALTPLSETSTTPAVATLLYWGISPYCYKVRMAAAYKGVRFDEQVCSGPQLMTARRQTGYRKVPVIHRGDSWVTDSTTILEWLERERPDPSLLPDDPRAHADCRLLEDWADEALGPAAETWIWTGGGRLAQLNAICAAEQTHWPSAVFMRMVRPLQRRAWNSRAARFGGVDATRALMCRQLDMLEARLDGRDWLFGDRPSAADFAVAGQLANLLRFGIAGDLDARPTAAALVRRAASMLSERSVFGVEEGA